MVGQSGTFSVWVDVGTTFSKFYLKFGRLFRERISLEIWARVARPAKKSPFCEISDFIFNRVVPRRVTVYFTARLPEVGASTHTHTLGMGRRPIPSPTVTPGTWEAPHSYLE